jgi:hypothetical protein
MFGFKKKEEPKVEPKKFVFPETEIDIEHLPIQAIEWDYDKSGEQEGTVLILFISPKDGDADGIRGSLIERVWFNTTEDEHNAFVRRFRRKLGLTDDGKEVKEQKP